MGRMEGVNVQGIMENRKIYPRMLTDHQDRAV